MADLIDRQAAIDVLETILPANPLKSEYTQGITCGAALAIEYVKQLPSAQPEQMDCEYCHEDSDGYVRPIEKNSHAFINRDKIVLKANRWRGEAKIKYCPMCGRRVKSGADMRGEDE